MWGILRIGLRLSILTLGIAVAAYLLPGISATDWRPIVQAALLLAVLNILLKPFLLILTLPINLLSLGLFTFIINGFIFWLVARAITGFEVSGFLTSIAAAAIISVLSLILNRVVSS
ncbi:MAG: phage holin family protein [Deltaproteobacteria bacterium]|nr:phage holin family protein [Deltaproteobacteria bacterium]